MSAKKHKPRHEPDPSKPSDSASVDALHRHVLGSVDECLSEARSILECAALCLDELADPRDVEVGVKCELSDVNVLVRLGIERLGDAKASIDLCDVGGAACRS